MKNLLIGIALFVLVLLISLACEGSRIVIAGLVIALAFAVLGLYANRNGEIDSIANGFYKIGSLIAIGAIVLYLCFKPSGFSIPGIIGVLYIIFALCMLPRIFKGMMGKREEQEVEINVAEEEDEDNSTPKILTKESLNPKGYKILFFDTETTGLLDTDARLVQLSWILADGPANENIYSTGDYIIKPDGFTIPPSAIAKHGITTERAIEEGAPLNDILEKFLADLRQCDYYVCHNVNFDREVIKRECERTKHEDELKGYPDLCTMRNTTNKVRIPSRNGFKWPTLSELYKFLFGVDFERAHNALYDIKATYDCFWECLRRNWFNHPSRQIIIRRKKREAATKE